MPDRLPSLIVLVGFWVPPAVAGWRAARRTNSSSQSAPSVLLLGTFCVMYAAAWFYFNLHRMPPYIPGATMDPTYASAEATRWLAAVAGAFVLPGSVLAWTLAYRWRIRTEGTRSPG